MTTLHKSFPGLELEASKLKKALDEVKTNPWCSRSLLRHCEFTQEDFCQGIVEMHRHGWRDLRFNTLCASVVSTTMLANTAKRNQKDPNNKKGTAELDHRGILQQVSLFIVVETNVETNDAEEVKLRDGSPTTALETNGGL